MTAFHVPYKIQITQALKSCKLHHLVPERHLASLPAYPSLSFPPGEPGEEQVLPRVVLKSECCKFSIMLLSLLGAHCLRPLTPGRKAPPHPLPPCSTSACRPSDKKSLPPPPYCGRSPYPPQCFHCIWLTSQIWNSFVHFKENVCLFDEAAVLVCV